MTDRKQPHPQRCETCKNVDCDLHEQGKGNRNPETGYEWDHHYWYHKIIDEVGCASHSSATEPAPDLSHIREDRRGCLNCLNPDCPVWQTADQNCWKSQKEHDAATKQAAREEVIQQFIDFGMSGKCVKTDKAEAVSCDAICERDCFVCFAESLRGGDAP